MEDDLTPQLLPILRAQLLQESPATLHSHSTQPLPPTRPDLGLLLTPQSSRRPLSDPRSGRTGLPRRCPDSATTVTAVRPALGAATAAAVGELRTGSYGG